MLKEKSPKKQIRQWVADRVDEVKEKPLSEITDEAIQYFASDQEFVEKLFQEEMRTFFHKIVSETTSYTRSNHTPPVVLGENIVSRDEFDKRVEERTQQRTLSRWERWKEHSGERHISLTAMTRTDLALAFQERRDRGDREYARADFLSTLYEKLTNDNQTVGDVLTEDEIQAIYEQTVGGNNG